jgi:hypothetical protein
VALHLQADVRSLFAMCRSITLLHNSGHAVGLAAAATGGTPLQVWLGAYIAVACCVTAALVAQSFDSSHRAMTARFPRTQCDSPHFGVRNSGFIGVLCDGCARHSITGLWAALGSHSTRFGVCMRYVRQPRSPCFGVCNGGCCGMMCDGCTRRSISQLLASCNMTAHFPRV